MSEPMVARVWRGELVESVHIVDVAVVEDDGSPAGRLVTAFGDVEWVTFMRSASKPLQALASWRCGLRERFGIEEGSPALAIMSASHGATPEQVAAVRDILQRAGLGEADLRCGYHEPASAAGRARLAAEGGAPSAIDGNCSGKHAGMLAACVAQGWPTETYLDFDHPLQARVREVWADLCGVRPGDLIVGGDGCGLPNYAVSLRAMARAFARLADDAGELPPRGVAGAMQAHPELVGPPEGFNVALLRTAPHLVAKSGAEGVFCVGWPERRLGLAVKVRDGQQRAIAPVTLAALREIGWLKEAQAETLAELATPRIRDLRGAVVGRIEAGWVEGL